jgi:uncharacterized OsmC-like protein
MLRKTVTRASCRVELDYYLRGSVLRGTVESGCTACRTHFTLDSPESDEDVTRIVRLAKQGCFAEQMVQTAVPLTSTYVLKGEDRVVEL